MLAFEDGHLVHEGLRSGNQYIHLVPEDVTHNIAVHRIDRLTICVDFTTCQLTERSRSANSEPFLGVQEFDLSVDLTHELSVKSKDNGAMKGFIDSCFLLFEYTVKDGNKVSESLTRTSARIDEEVATLVCYA
jgi:hypothetical protein